MPHVHGGALRHHGLHPLAVSTTVNEIVYGTPSATPLALPKLDRMSLRTTPLSVSTSAPFEPSPGYGPAVSSGMMEHDVTVAVAAPVVVVAPAVVDVLDVLELDAAVPDPPLPQPAASAPRPPSSTRRRGGRRTEQEFDPGSSRCLAPTSLARRPSRKLREVQETREIASVLVAVKVLVTGAERNEN